MWIFILLHPYKLKEHLKKMFSMQPNLCNNKFKGNLSDNV